MHKLSSFALGAICVVSSACSLDAPVGGRTFPQVRLVNAAPATAGLTPAVTAHLNQSTNAMAPSISYPGQTDGCPLILSATHEIAFEQNGTTLAATTNRYDLDGRYTVVVTNTGTQYRALQLSDRDAVAVGNNGLRFINATSTAGDVYVTPPGVAPSAAYKVRSNLAPLATTTEVPPYVQRPETDIRIRLYDVGDTSTPRSDVTLGQLFASKLATIVFIPSTGASDPGGFQVNPCN